MRELTSAEVAVNGANQIDLDHQLFLAHFTQCLRRPPRLALQVGVDDGEAGVSFAFGSQALTLPQERGLRILIGYILAAYVIHLLQQCGSLCRDNLCDSIDELWLQADDNTGLIKKFARTFLLDQLWQLLEGQLLPAGLAALQWDAMLKQRACIKRPLVTHTTFVLVQGIVSIDHQIVIGQKA